VIARRATAGVAALSGLCLPATLAIAGFDAGVEYETGVEPVAVTSADFDHDGNKDLAVTNLSEGDVSVLEANFVGDGTFEGHVRYTVGAGPTAIVATDLDRDGNKDLAVTTEGQDEVAILEAGFSGNGTFEPADDYDVGDTPIAVAAADFTSDGRKDLVVANFLDDNVSLLECKRNGTLKPALDTPVGSKPVGMAVSDFNRDGDQDLAVASSSDGDVVVLEGDGDGNFGAPDPYPVGGVPQRLVAADFDKDGKEDLAVVNAGDDDVSVLEGKSDGTFKSAVDYPAGLTPLGIASGDFDEDGNKDLAVSNSDGANVSILEGNGDAGFDAFTAGLAPRYCNFRKASIYAGSNEIQRNIISKMTLGL